MCINLLFNFIIIFCTLFLVMIACYSLTFQLVVMHSQSETDTENPLALRSELNDKVKDINNLRNELERTKKDKNITSGLVTQMQRDMSNKVRQHVTQCAPTLPSLVNDCTMLFAITSSPFHLL